MWLVAHAVQPELPEVYDDIVCAYLFNPQTGQYRISRSRTGHLSGGVVKVLPHSKGKLVYAKHLLTEWATAQPTRHTPPMPWVTSLTRGNWLGLQGLPRVGALLVLQSRTGGRPAAAWLAAQGLGIGRWRPPAWACALVPSCGASSGSRLTLLRPYGGLSDRRVVVVDAAGQPPVGS